MIHIAVCDDVKYYRNRIGSFLKQYFSIKSIEIKIDFYASGVELCENKQNNKVDILFLDIDMDQMNGIETARRLKEQYSDTFIVFVTAFISYSMEGYKVDAIRYILKDQKDFDLALIESLDTILERMKTGKQFIEISFIEGTKRIMANQLEYIESSLHKLTFHIVNSKSKYTKYDKLESMEIKLNKEYFGRIHQSYLVNMIHIRKYERYKLMMQSGTEIPIPRAKYNVIVSQILNCKGVL